MGRSNVPLAPRPLDCKSDRRRWSRAQRDRILDPYKRIGKVHGSTVSPQCDTAFHHGRWQWMERPAGAEEALCQACHRINDRYLPVSLHWPDLSSPRTSARSSGLCRKEADHAPPDHSHPRRPCRSVSGLRHPTLLPRQIRPRRRSRLGEESAISSPSRCGQTAGWQLVCAKRCINHLASAPDSRPCVGTT